MQAPGGEAVSLFGAGEQKGTAVDPNTPGAFCWAELMTRDVDTAGGFYSQVFPWSTKSMDMPTGPYTIFSVGETMVAGMMNMPAEVPEQVPAHWMPYVMVADCRASTEKARSLGATFMVENLEVPTVGTLSTFADPTGAALSFIQFSG
jgi:predicted enzyme related to lactoylglutathione lyase